MNEGALREYEQLRTELLHADRLVLEVLSITVGAWCLILGQGVLAQEPLIFILPLPLLSIAQRYAADKRWCIWVIASYLKHYIEVPGSGIHWETRLHQMRTYCDRQGVFCPGQNIVRVECLFFTVLASLSLLGFIYYAGKSPVQWWGYVLAGLLFASVIWAAANSYFRLCREGREGALLDASWPELEGADDPAGSTDDGSAR
ncbi:MAG: hypothetical protein ACP5KN_20105 [Armatimonadota bacterium]